MIATTTASTVDTARPAADSGWIVSPAFDLLVFLFSAAVTLVPWQLVDVHHVQPAVVLALVAITANGPHLVSTWTRVYLDGHERTRRPIPYYVVPALITAAVLAFILVDGDDTPWLRTGIFYWASWHFAAQCWGLLRIYQRKHGVAHTPLARVEKILLFSSTGWCVLHRLYTGPWELFGVPIWHPHPTAWLVNGVGAAVATLAIAYAARFVLEAIKGRRPDARRPLFIATTFFAFLVPFLVIHNGTAAFAAAAWWHAIQYLGIVWFYNRNRWQGGVDPQARLVSYVSNPRRWPLYFLMLLAFAGVAYGSILILSRVSEGTTWTFGTWSLLVWTSLTFSHYYLDGVIWKLRRDTQLTKALRAT